MIIPPFLQAGDRVAILSPSGSIDVEYLNNAVNHFEAWGLKPYVSKHAAGSHHIFSGTIEERTQDLQEALDDKSCKAIFCSRGGYGAVQVLDRLIPHGFVRFPKWIVGFSDITVLHAWAQKHGIASLHADMPKTFPYKEEDTSLLSIHNFLLEKSLAYLWNGHTSREDMSVQGEIVGGNLSVLHALLGTSYQAVFDNRILFIEDLNEHLYHVDRMMYSLKLSGVLNRIKALLIGSFTDMKDSDPPFGKSVEDIIMDAVGDEVPVFFDIPAGHQKPNVAIPLGMQLRIESEKNEINLTL